MGGTISRLFSAGRRLRVTSDRGSFIIEAMVGTLIFAVAVMGVVGSMTSGLSLVGNSKQRSAAVAVAQERLERVHTIPYDRVKLYQAPVHSNDTFNPDNAVSTDNLRYTVEGTTTEPLIVDAANGAIKHIDDPVRVGSTEFNIYQYVTWHDDPHVAGSTQDYKRVVVVVTWKFPVHSGTANRLTQSSYIGGGGITTPASTPAPSASPSAPPTPTPVPSSTPSASCPGDITGPASPSLAILSGAGAVSGFTNTTNVQVRLTATDACGPIAARMLNGTATNCLAISPATTVTSGVTSTVTWTVPPTPQGSKTITACFTDGVGNASSIVTGTIVLDTFLPSIPTNVRKSSCSMSSSTRTVTLTWDAATDANFLGYRIYKSVNQGAFTVLTTSSSQSVTDTDSKSYSSLTYRVTAYDKAGNQSTVPNDLSFSKNSC